MKFDDKKGLMRFVTENDEEFYNSEMPQSGRNLLLYTNA